MRGLNSSRRGASGSQAGVGPGADGGGASTADRTGAGRQDRNSHSNEIVTEIFQNENFGNDHRSVPTVFARYLVSRVEFDSGAEKSNLESEQYGDRNTCDCCYLGEICRV